MTFAVRQIPWRPIIWQLFHYAHIYSLWFLQFILHKICITIGIACL